MCLIVLSFFNFFYLLCYEPFKSFQTNLYVSLMEFAFLVLCCCAFLFTDATPTLNVKTGAAVVGGISMWLMLAMNVIYVLYYLVIGRVALKERRKSEFMIKKTRELKAFMVNT